MRERGGKKTREDEIVKGWVCGEMEMRYVGPTVGVFPFLVTFLS